MSMSFKKKKKLMSMEKKMSNRIIFYIVLNCVFHSNNKGGEKVAVTNMIIHDVGYVMSTISDMLHIIFPIIFFANLIDLPLICEFMRVI
jgi:hypothetical protein